MADPASTGINTAQVASMNAAAGTASSGATFSTGIQDFFARLGGAVQQGWQFAKANLAGKGGFLDISNLGTVKAVTSNPKLQGVPGLGGNNTKPISEMLKIDFGPVAGNGNIMGQGIGGGNGPIGMHPTSLPISGGGTGRGTV